MTDSTRVLYVDDEPDLLDICRIFLEGTGDFSVATIDSAPAALDLLAGGQFDAIISDYQMPGMNGIQFLIEVREKFGSVPFILFTGKGREEVVIQAINSGADFYLQKGGEPKAQFAELVHKINQATSRKRAEEALRESEERYDQLAGQGGTIIWEVDARGLYTYVNHVSEAVWGYRPEELVGRMHFYDLSHESERDKFQAACFAVFERKELFEDLINAVQAKDGRVVWVSTNGIPILNADGTLRGYRGSDTDITRRRQAEEALRESEEKFRLLAEKTNDIIYSMDPGGNITYVSPQISRYGYTPGEIISGGLSSLIHAEDLPRVLEDARVTASTGNPTITIFRIRDKSGATFWMEDSGSAVYDTSGTVSAISGIVRDITERKLAEEAIKRSELRVTTLLEHMPLGIIVADPETTRFVFASENFCRMLGYRAEEIPGLNLPDIHPAEDLPNVMVEFERLMRGESLSAVALRVKRRDGSVFFADIRTTKVELDGRASVLAVFTDVTERRQAEEALLGSHNQLAESEAGLRIHQAELETQADELKTAQLALIESRDKYLDLYEFAPLGYLTLNDTGLIEEVNLTAATLLGVERSRLLNVRFRKFVAEKENDQWYRYFRQLLGQMEKQVCTLMLIRGDGSTFPARLEGVRIDDSSKGNTRVKVTISDITDIRVAEEALRESEERFSNAFEYAAIGMALISTGGRWLRVNQSICDITGYSRNELQAMTFQDITHPDDLGIDLEYVRRMIAGEIRTYQMEKRYFHKTGQLVWVLLSVSLVRDNQGTPLYFISQIENISGRKEAEEALKKSEEEYRRLVEQSSDGIWLLDKEFLTVYVNPAMEEILGYSKVEMAGRSWYEFGDPEWVMRAKELEKRRESGIGEPHEFLFIHKDGRKVLARISTTPLYNNDGRFDGAIGVLSDITRQKQAEEAIRESKERYRTLFDTITQGVVYQDREGCIIDANPGALRILGLSLDQMKGRTPDNPQWMPVHEDGSVFPGETNPVMVALKTGKEVRDVIMGITHPGKEERTWIRINAVPQFRPGEDTPYQVYTTFDDISGSFGPAGKNDSTGGQARQGN